MARRQAVPPGARRWPPPSRAPTRGRDALRRAALRDAPSSPRVPRSQMRGSRRSRGSRPPSEAELAGPRRIADHAIANAADLAGQPGKEVVALLRVLAAAPFGEEPH